MSMNSKTKVVKKGMTQPNETNFFIFLVNKIQSL